MFLNLKKQIGAVIRKTRFNYLVPSSFSVVLSTSISRGFSLFELAGWPRCATIARGTPYAPMTWLGKKKSQCAPMTWLHGLVANDHVRQGREYVRQGHEHEREGRDHGRQGRDHERQGREQDTTMCAKDVIMCGKDANMCAKDATMTRP